MTNQKKENKSISQELEQLKSAANWIRENEDKVKEAASVEEESGVYPHDCITRITVDFEGDGHSIYYQEEFYSDRDGEEYDSWCLDLTIDGIDLVYRTDREGMEAADALWDAVGGLVC